VPGIDDDLDPRIGAQAGIDQPIADVDRGDVRRAALEQAVGEAAGRGADVEAAQPHGLQPEVVERGRELAPGARDERLRRTGDRERGVVRDSGSGLVDTPAGDRHQPRHHRPACLLPRVEQPALHQRLIEPQPAPPRHATKSSGPGHLASAFGATTARRPQLNPRR